MMDYSKMKKSELVDLVKQLITTTESKDKISSTYQVASEFRKRMKRWGQEHFMVIFLDNGNNIISVETMYIGTVNCSLVSTREVFIEALKKEAVKIIIGHNHPSGSVKPSPEDISLTKKFSEAGKLLNIELLDHVIFTNDNFFSFNSELLI